MKTKRTLNDIYVDALALAAGAVVVILLGLLWGARAFAASPTPPQVAECRNFEGDIIPCSWLMPTDEDRRKECHAHGCRWRYFDNFCYSTYPHQCGECVCEDTGAATQINTYPPSSITKPIELIPPCDTHPGWSCWSWEHEVTSTSTATDTSTVTSIYAPGTGGSR